MTSHELNDAAVRELFRALAFAYGTQFIQQFGQLDQEEVRRRWLGVLASMFDVLVVDRVLQYLLRTTSRPPNLADVVQAIEATHVKVAL